VKWIRSGRKDTIPVSNKRKRGSSAIQPVPLPILTPLTTDVSIRRPQDDSESQKKLQLEMVPSAASSATNKSSAPGIILYNKGLLSFPILSVSKKDENADSTDETTLITSNNNNQISISVTRSASVTTNPNPVLTKSPYVDVIGEKALQEKRQLFSRINANPLGFYGKHGYG